MTKRRSTKGALLMSVLSLFLCFSMLLGTTFAWFTDEVESGKNVIKSGNLDITLEYYNGTDWLTVEGASAILDETALWEPGYTEVAYFRIKNNGSLALKYQFGVNIVSETEGVNKAGESFKLSDYIYFDVVEDVNGETARFADRNAAMANATETTKISAGYSKAGELKAGTNEFVYLAMVIYMPTTVGNVANYKTGTEAPTIELGVNVVATQLASESDGFDTDYDEDAWVEGWQVYNAQDLQAAINNGETNITLMDDIDIDEPIVIPAAPTTYSLSDATVYTVIDLNGNTINTAYAEGSTTNHVYAFTNNGNLLLKNGTVNARGIFNYGNMIIENVTINAIDGNGGYAIRNYSGSTLTMNSGKLATTLEDDHLVNAGGYDATTLRVDAGASAVINGGTIENICDFTVAIDNYGTATINAGKISSVHSTVANSGTLTVNGGEFTCNGVDGKTQHVIWAAAGTTTINGGTFDGKDTYNGFNVDASAGANVTINGGNFLPVHSGSLYGEGTITVYGGTFANDVSDRVADGYSVVNNNNVWNVIKGDVVAGNNSSLNDALANGESNIALGAGDFSMPSTSGDVSISGTLDTVITINKPTANKVALNGVTVVGSGNYTGIQHSDTVIYENCVIKGVQFLYANTVIFKNCTIDLTEKADYIWTYDAKNVEFIDCTFNTAGKAILIYHEGASTQTNVTVTGCTFNATASALASGHVAAAIEIDSSLSPSGHYTLTTSNNVVDSDFSGEWRVKKSATNNTTVNGVIYNKVDDGLYKGTDNTYYVYNANGLAALNAMMVNQTAGEDVVVNIIADIDFAGKTWTPVDSHADSKFEIDEINGNGHTIYNLTVNGQAMFKRFAGSGDVVIKDITFDGATVNSNGAINTSLLTVQTYQNTLLDNVDVKNSTITGGYKVATLVGTVYNENPSTITLTVKDCDVDNCTVTTTVYDFMTCGLVAFVYVGDNDTVVFENTTISNVVLANTNSGGYNYHAFVYYNDQDTNDCFNEAEGVTVSGCTFENK